MTRNLYLGADLDPVVAAEGKNDPLAVFDAVSKAWATILGTNFPERAEVLAKEIEQNKPMLVGLQEVSLYRTGKFRNPAPATEEVKGYDYLDTLLCELNERHLTPSFRGMRIPKFLIPCWSLGTLRTFGSPTAT